MWKAALAVALAVLVFAQGAAAQEAYRLGAGDKVRVLVFGEEDLSGTFNIDGEGRIALPLIGTVALTGMSAPEAEHAIAARFAEGYLKDPRVAVEVLDRRPFYILGEVRTPGAYPYADGLTVLGAVAVAGGFTYRADEDDIRVTRGGGSPEVMPAEAVVRPGDVIRVHQRLF
ncbi:MAG: polysaccharide biosynthesis/export family protein [Rhodospirillaceae bacterium]